MALKSYCGNLNHRHSNPPVRFCSMCGEVVNERIPTQTCNEERHAETRAERSKYCVNCGEQLIRVR
jgi:hypothetical protein